MGKQLKSKILIEHQKYADYCKGWQGQRELGGRGDERLRNLHQDHLCIKYTIIYNNCRCSATMLQVKDLMPHPCWMIHCWCFSIMCFDAGFKAVYRKLWCSALSTSPLCCALALPLSKSKGLRALRFDTWQSRTGSGMFVLQWKMHSACCHKRREGAICVCVCEMHPSPPTPMFLIFKYIFSFDFIYDYELY